MMARMCGQWGSFARASIGIIAGKRGMVYGECIWTTNGERTNGMQGTGLSIEPNMDGIQFHLGDEVKNILVVEKETVFHRLVTDAGYNPAHNIIVTGKGYPDVSTRLFVRALIRQYPRLGRRLYGLVDNDPHVSSTLTLPYIIL
jgi:meiotic recombination protein SPO11